MRFSDRREQVAGLAIRKLVRHQEKVSARECAAAFCRNLQEREPALLNGCTGSPDSEAFSNGADLQ
jgi:hypothetical protein